MKVSSWKWLAGLLLCGALAWPITARLREHQAAHRVAHGARAALGAGRLPAAEAAVARYLKVSPDSAEAHALAAHVALEKGALDKVTDELNKARSLGYPKPELERIHAIVLVRVGRYSEAEPILVRIYERNQGPDPAVDGALARLYLMTYRLGRAEEVIQRWIRDAPTDGRPYLWLTEIDRRMEVDNLDTQRRHYRQALERDPDLDAARLGLAQTLRQMHRNAEAKPEFSGYLARYPDDPTALFGAGRNAVELGEITDAAQFLDRAARIAPNNVEVLKGKASLHMALGQTHDALACLDRALAADPFDTEALYARSRARTSLGDIAGAGRDLELFKQYERDHLELLALRGSLMAHPTNNELRSKVAQWMFAHGRIDEGLGWTNAVLASDPNHPAANQLLADHYAKEPKTAGLANLYRLRAAARGTGAR
jgi:tetratricopeptide (TPR) repeat protein